MYYLFFFLIWKVVKKHKTFFWESGVRYNLSVSVGRYFSFFLWLVLTLLCTKSDDQNGVCQVCSEFGAWLIRWERSKDITKMITLYMGYICSKETSVEKHNTDARWQTRWAPPSQNQFQCNNPIYACSTMTLKSLNSAAGRPISLHLYKKFIIPNWHYTIRYRVITEKTTSDHRQN